MKRFLSLCLTFVLLQSAFSFVLLPLNLSAQQAAALAVSSDETITNNTIIEMTKSGVSESVIIEKIKTTKGSFDTTAASLQELKKSGVSDSVILAIVQKTAGMEVSASTQAKSVNAISVSIPDGTEIKVVAPEDISGQKVVEGDPLMLKMAEDLIINGKKVIAKGAMVKGTVSSAKKKGFMGKGGDLSIRIESTETVDGQKIKLRASKSGTGGDNMGSTVALTVLFGPLGLLRKGKEAKIKAGTVLSAYTDEAKTVAAN